MRDDPEAKLDAQRLIASPVFKMVIEEINGPARHVVIYGPTFEKREEARLKVIAIDELVDHVRRIAGELK